MHLSTPPLLLLASLALGCSESNSSAAPASNNIETGTDSGASVLDPCAKDINPPADGAVCVATVSGRFVDLNGTPVHDGFGVSVCGFVCINGETDADGYFSVDIGRYLVLSEFSTLPHGRPLLAGYYFPLPDTADSSDIDVGQLAYVPLPESGAALDLLGTTEQQLESEGVRLVLAAGTQTKLAFEDLLEGELGAQFRAVEVSPTQFEAVRVSEYNFSSLHAVGPFEASFTNESDTPITIAPILPNSSGLPAGSAVEILAQGSYLYPEWLKPARFEVVSLGQVSDDGASISFDTGGGVEHLTWLGVRPVTP